jgi:glutaminyl-peptide cyclotransferase
MPVCLSPFLNAFVLSLTLAAALVARSPDAQAAVPVYGYEVVHTYPHDSQAFTEGLFYLNGFLYESTGLEGHSTIRKVALETGKVVQQVDVPPEYFGEGIVNWKQRLFSLTWKTQVGFEYDLATFKVRRRFAYSGEGWALTQDGKHLIMSDGTPELRFLDPNTLRETGRITVTYEGKSIRNVNELEWVKGRIYANVWQTDMMIMIDPVSGEISGVVNLAGLISPQERQGTDSVLNGIAYDAAHDRLFVTGKNWPKLFQIRILPAGQIR